MGTLKTCKNQVSLTHAKRFVCRRCAETMEVDEKISFNYQMDLLKNFFFFWGQFEYQWWK